MKSYQTAWGIWRKTSDGEDWLRYCAEIAKFSYEEALKEAKFLTGGNLRGAKYEPRRLN